MIARGFLTRTWSALHGRRMLSVLLVALVAAALLAPATAFATVVPFATLPPVAGGGGGSGELYPWGWGVETHTNGAVWGDDALDTKVMFTPRATTYITAGPQTFLGYVDKNPNGVYLGMLKLTKSGTTDVPMSIVAASRNSLGYLTYISANGTLFSTSTSTQGWFFPCSVSTLDPGTHYSLRFLRGIRANNSITGVIYTNGSGAELGYLQNPSGNGTYPDENAQYTAKQFDTFTFRNCYLGTYEDFQFQFQTYADTTAFDAALAGAQSALTTATANSGTAPGQVDPARVAILNSAVTSATAAAPTINQRLQPDVDAAVNVLDAAVAQAQVFEALPVATTLSGIPSGWTSGTVTFSLEATGGTPPLTSVYALGSGDITTYTAPVTFSSEGVTSLSYHSVDAIGRAEDAQIATIRIDTLAPLTSLEGQPAGGVSTGPATLSISTLELGSGLSGSFYTIDGGSPTAYVGPFSVSGNGSHTVTYWSVDDAGNVETAHSATFQVVPQPTPGWSWQSPSPQGNNLTSVFYLDASTGWAVGDVGTIMKTNDGGSSWVPEAAGTTQPLKSIFFLDASTGWASGTGVILKTVDGGATWAAQTAAVGANAMDSIFFLDASNGWATGANGVIFRTANGGTTWSQQTSPTTKELMAVRFADVNNGWAAGKSGTIVATTNGGTTWTTQASGTTQHLYGLALTSANSAVAVGAVGTIVRTSNGTTWTLQTSGSATLMSVSFIGGVNGWAVGTGAAILHTADGGATWSPETSNVTPTLNCVHFTDASHGTAVGSYGQIVRTVDGGTTWTSPSKSIPTSQFTAVSFPDANNGWVVGWGGAIAHTANGGSTWTTETSGVSSNLIGVRFTDTNTGWVCGVSGVILKTTNSGATWAPQSSGTTADLKALCFVDANTGWTVSATGEILKTANGGSTWTKLTSGTTSPLQSVYFVDANTGWVAGYNGTIRKTVDGGTTWNAQTSGVSTILYGVSFADANTGWAVGAASAGAGVILKTTDGGTTWTPQASGNPNGLNAVCALSGNSAWAVGGTGLTLRTTNGGATWTTQPSGTQQTYNAAFFTSPDYGWAVGGNSSGAIVRWYSSPTGPATTIAGVPAGWSSTPVTFTLAASGGNAPFVTRYGLNGAAVTTYTAPVAVSTQGTTTVSYRTVDSIGQAETTNTATIRIDSFPPVTSLSGVPASQISSVPVTLTETALDLGSGCANSYYNIDASGLTTYIAPFAVSGMGAHQISYYSVDLAGNVESASIATFSISAGPPSTAISGNQAGWSAGAQTLTLTPSGDNGPLQTFYAIDGGSLMAYSGPFDVSAQGTTTVTYYSVNSVGEAETPQNATIKIDLGTPATTISGIPASTTTDTVTFNLSGTDGLSGVARSYYTVDGMEIATTLPRIVAQVGDHTVTYWSVDNAGNTEPAHTATFTIKSAWSWLNPLPQGNNLMSVFFADANNGWAVGQWGSMVRTTNGGATWTKLESGTSNGLSSVFFVNASTGWASGGFGTLLKTTDGGSTWAHQNSGASRTLYALSFVNDTTGWAAGSGGTILKTTDAGASWVSQPSGTSSTISSIASLDANTAWAVGAPGMILKTTDGGATWVPQASGTTQSLLSVSFANATNGWVVGEAGTILATTDGGATWAPQTSGVVQQLTGVSFGGASNGVAVGAGGVILKTSDGGATWTIAVPPAPTVGIAYLYGVRMRDTSSACAVGLDGKILETADGGATWAEQSVGASISGVKGVAFTDAMHGVAVCQASGANTGILKTTDGGVTWASQVAPFTGLGAVQFSDSQHGWVAGGSGVIAKSTDGGTTWSAVASPFHNTISGVCFIDANTGWVVGASGAIYKTVDAGASWAPESSGTGAYLNEVRFVDASTGWAFGYSGTILKTIDGGATWAPQVSGTTLALNSGWFVDANTGWAVGGSSSGILMKTTDGGTTWTSQAANSPLYSVRFADANNGWAVGSGTSLKTTDGGATWVSKATGTTTTLNDVAVMGKVAWAVGEGGVILKIGADVPPVTSISGNTAAWSATPEVITLTASGDYGPFSTHYSLNGGADTFYTGPFTVSTSGTTTVSYHSVDSIGQAETPKTATLQIDSAAPVTTISGVPASGLALDSVTFSLSATDGGSGVANSYYTLDGGAQTAYSTPASVTTTGTHTVAYWSVDSLGNTEVAHTATFKILPTWVALTSGATASLNDVFVLDGKQAWAVGGDGFSSTIVHTTDGGATWTPQNGGVTWPLAGVWFSDANHGVAVGASGSVIRTVDGGAHWTPINIGNTLNYEGPYFVDANTGWIVGAVGGVVFKTTDGGASWTQQVSPTSEQLNDVKFVDENTGWAVGTNTIIHTTDGGAHWVLQTVPTATVLWSCSFSDANHGVAFGSGNVMLSTSDGGTTWTQGTAPGIQRTSFIDGNTGWGVASGGKIYKTSDGGTTWTLERSGSGLIGINARNASTAFAVGSAGTIVKLDPPMTTAAGFLPGWSTVPVAFSLTATGAAGPIDTYYSLNGGTPISYTAPVTVSDAGTTTVSYWSVDALGRTEFAGTSLVRIRPVATYISGLASGWVTATPTFSLVSSGAATPISTYYSINGGATSPYTSPVGVVGQGVTNVSYWSVDALNRTEPANSATVMFDSVSPVTSVSGVPAGVTLGPITFSLSATDAASGVSKTYFSVDGNASQEYANPLTISTVGTHTVSYYASDVAGNIASPVTSTFKIVAGWASQTSGTSDIIYGASFVSPTTGWVTTTAGKILKTSDGGATWALQTSGTTQQLRSVSFVDANTGWAVGYAGTILSTTNGGATWAPQASGTTNNLMGVKFADATHGWAVGASGTILFTTDGGATWTPQSSGTPSLLLQSVSFTDANNGWACGGGTGATMLHTSNGGATWVPQTSLPVSSVFFIDASNGWACGASGVIEHTTNGGVTWSGQTSGLTQTLNAVSATSASNAWVVGQGGRILRTVNGGASWALMPSPVNQAFYAISFADATNGWIAGNAGAVIATIKPVTTSSGIPAGWATAPVSVTLTAGSDDASPISTFAKLGASAFAPYTAPFTITGEGTTTVGYYSTDALGRSEGAKTATVRIDTVKPVTSISGLPSGGSSLTTVTFSLAAADAISGVSSTSYTLDGGATTAYTAPVSVWSKGSHTVTYWSTDVAGNVEAGQSAAFTIASGVLPVTTVSGIPAGWSTSTVTFSLAATGEVAPISSYFALGAGAVTTYTAPVAVSTQGATTLSYYSIDAASQRETTKTATIRIDTAAPVTSSDAVATYAGSATIHLSAADAVSGVAHTYYKLDGGAQTEGLTISTSGLGAHSIEFWSADTAGNIETPHKSANFTISDAVAPTTISDAAATYLNSASIHLTATDNASGSGVAHTYYKLDGGAQVEGTTIGTAVYGAHSIEFWSTDVAGNVEAPHKTAAFFIDDSIAPVTTSDAVASYVGTATIHLSATDNTGGSGVAHRYYKLDGGAQAEGATIVVTSVGAHTLEFWSVDAEANIETPHKSASFTLTPFDIMAPSTTSNAVSSFTGTATITLAAVDNVGGTGVAHTYWKLDGGATTEGATCVVTALGAHTLEYWSVDVAGNEEAHHTANFTVVAAVQATTITIKSSAYSTNIGKTPTLSGVVTPTGIVGTNIVVYVMKAGSSRWTYSSNRTAYAAGGGAAWLYKYYFKKGMARGTYRFKAVAPAPGFASSAGFLTSTSKTILVTVR
jgi:photosystem II stability/assembly factor-like uncharacterized protein